MSRKRNLNDVEINIDNIREELSSDFEAICAELHKRLNEKSKYKRLKRIGEEQYYKGHDSVLEMESQNTRLCMAVISLLVHEVSDSIDSLIREKFQDDFLTTLKDRVLKAILKLYSVPKNDTEDASDDDKVLFSLGSSDVKQKKDEKLILEKLKDLSQVFADNLIDIKKQMIEMPLEEPQSDASGILTEAASSVTNKTADINNDKIDEGNISFGSVSSVHTSELSSFDDSIVFSSDEETGEKEKRMSLKAVQEKLTELKEKKLTDEKDDQNEAKTTKHDCILESETPLKDSSSDEKKSLSQRLRKPNSKYATDVILTPLRRASAEKVPTSSPASRADNSLPPKRGRPRKYFT